MPHIESAKKMSCNQKDCDKILREDAKDLEPPISFSLPTHDNEVKISFECERRRNKDLKCILTSELDTERQSREILDNLNHENESTSRRKAEIMDSMAETKILSQQVEGQKSKTQTSYNTAKTEINVLKKNNDDLQEELLKLQETLRCKAEKLRKIEDYQKQEIACLCKEKESLLAKIKNIGNDMSLAKTTLKGLKQRDQQVDKNLTDTEEALNEIRLTHESDVTNILLLKEKIESTCQQFHIDKEEEQNLKEELQQLEEIIEQQRKSLECIQSETEILSIKLKELVFEIDCLKPKDEKLKKILNKLEIESQEKERTRVVCQQMIQTLQNSLLMAQKCYAEKKSTLKQLKQEIAAKREAMSKFRGLDN